jgi:hypothetical protein
MRGSVGSSRIPRDRAPLRIYITSQIIQRELDSRLLLSAHLTALGHTVSFGPRPALLAHRAVHGPGVYVLSNASRKGFINNGETDGLAFVILDEEALLLDDTEEFVTTRLDPELTRRSALNFCWGPRQFEAVLATVPESASALRVTGNPRFELLEPRFHEVYRSEYEEIQSRIGRSYVLINSNILESEQDPWLADMRSHLKDLARGLAAHRPDITIVFRPHPSDRAEARVDRSGLPNLAVTSEGPIAAWLAGAAAVFHNSCTTGIEARVMAKPVFSYRPTPDRQYGALPNSLSVTVRSFEEACEALDRVLAGDIPEHPDLTPLDRYVVRPGSGEPSRRIAEEIDRLSIPTGAAGPVRPGPIERLRVRWKGAPAKPWNRIALRERLPAIRDRYMLIARAAGLDHAVTIRAPQPSLIDIAPP